MAEKAFVEAPQPTESKSFDWPKMVLAIVLGLTLLAGAAYAGYWYGTESSNLKTLIPETPTPEPTTPPVADPTTNWKTYTHKLYNYTIKYPPSLYLEELESPNGLVELVRFVNETGGGGEPLGVSVMVYDNPTNLSAEKWWEENARDMFSYQLPIKESISEERIIDGHDAYLIKSTREWFAAPFSDLFISKDNKIYEISTNFSEENVEDYILFDQILSTFKFLE